MRFLVIVLSVVLVWVGVLTAVALCTRRAVTFFPPQIGTDGAILGELRALQDRVKNLSDNEQKQRDRLIANLEVARERSIRIQQSENLFGSTDAAIVVSKCEQAVTKEEEEFLTVLKQIDSDVQKLAGKF